jgi:hypothetical protein
MIIATSWLRVRRSASVRLGCEDGEVEDHELWEEKLSHATALLKAGFSCARTQRLLASLSA